MVDSTIPSISASFVPLGYMGMASDSTIAVVSTSTTSVDMSSSEGGGGAPPPPLPTNLVLNTILQNMVQLQL